MCDVACRAVAVPPTRRCADTARRPRRSGPTRPDGHCDLRLCASHPARDEAESRLNRPPIARARIPAHGCRGVGLEPMRSPCGAPVLSAGLLPPPPPPAPAPLQPPPRGSAPKSSLAPDARGTTLAFFEQFPPQPNENLITISTKYSTQYRQHPQKKPKVRPQEIHVDNNQDERGGALTAD